MAHPQEIPGVHSRRYKFFSTERMELVGYELCEKEDAVPCK